MIQQIQAIFGRHVDKFAHLGISALLYLIVFAITKNERVSIGAVFLIGMAKELLDFLFYHAEVGDTVANIFGIILAVYFVRMILRG